MAIADKLFDAILGGLGRMAEAAEKARDRELGGKALLRSYFIEVANNLDLLACLDKEALKKSAVTSPAFAAVVSRLETRIAEVILTDENAARDGGLYDVLKGAESSGEAQTGIVYANVLEAVSFTVTKINLLRKLSTLTGEESALLHGLNLAPRVEHLNKRLRMVKTTLRGLGGVTGISPED
jgi:hypothetical protein